MAPFQPLLIRRSQMRALGLATLDTFFERLADHVAEVFPGHERFIRRPRGQRFMQGCLERARRYGLADENSIALFTDLAVALGERFDEQPEWAWIREILDDTGLGAAGKTFLIYKDLAERCPGAPVPPPADDDDNDEVPPPPEPKVPRQGAPLWWGQTTP